MARRRGEGGASCCERGRRHATVGPRCLARAYPICLCGDGLYATAALRGAPARARRAPPPRGPLLHGGALLLIDIRRTFTIYLF
jgi:hypothetical protein